MPTRREPAVIITNFHRQYGLYAGLFGWAEMSGSSTHFNFHATPSGKDNKLHHRYHTDTGNGLSTDELAIVKADNPALDKLVKLKEEELEACKQLQQGIIPILGKGNQKLVKQLVGNNELNAAQSQAVVELLYNLGEGR